MNEGHLIADNKADFLDQLKTIVEEQQDEARRQQLEDVEGDVIEPDSSAAVKVEEPPPSTEPQVEVTQLTGMVRSDDLKQTRTRLTSLNLTSETSVSPLPLNDRTNDDYFDLSCSPRDFPPIHDCVSQGSVVLIILCFPIKYSRFRRCS